MHEHTSSTLNPPALTDARNILYINMARGRMRSSGRSADNNPDAAVYIMSMHSCPHCQHANVLRASTWIYLQLAETGKRLYFSTNVANEMKGEAHTGADVV